MEDNIFWQKYEEIYREIANPSFQGHFSNHLMSVKPIAVTISVDGTPNLRWFQKDKVYPSGARRACSHTIKLAADPSNDRFPETVLTQAKISHAFFSSDAEIAAAEAATRPPSKRTEENTNKWEATRRLLALYVKLAIQN